MDWARVAFTFLAFYVFMYKLVYMPTRVREMLF